MHPVLFTIGNFELPAYGLILVVAFLLSTKLLRREATRMDLDGEKIADAAIVALLVGLVGAKVLLVLVDSSLRSGSYGLMAALGPVFWGLAILGVGALVYNAKKGVSSNGMKMLPWILLALAGVKMVLVLRDPQLRSFAVNTLRSAGVIYGGVIGGALGIWWYLRKHGLPLLSTLDVMVPFAALGMGLGRLSCLMAGCCYGMPYEGLFALHFPDHPQCDAPANIGLFPVQIVGLLNGLLLFGLLLFLLRRRKFPGQVFLAFVFLYGLTRGLIEFLRGDAVRGLWFDGLMSTSQIIALSAVVLAAVFYWKLPKEGLS